MNAPANDLIDEIHEIRARLAAEHSYDMAKLGEHARELEKKLAADGWKLVRRPAKPVSSTDIQS